MTDIAERTDAKGESKGERTRRRLLELAIERFGSQGYRATSVSEIARAANLTQAAAYAYFQNKEELFVAAVDADASGLIAEAHAQVDGTPIRQLFPAFIVYLLAGLDDHPLARRVLAGQEPEVIQRLVDLHALREFCDLMEDEMRRAQGAGEVRSDIDCSVMVAGIETIIISLLFSSVQSGGSVTERHQIGVVAAFDALLRPPT